MTDATTIVTRYLDAWNEPDVRRRRSLIAETFLPDARYVDPLQAGEGWDGIDGMIAAVQTRFPGYRFRPAGRIEGHNGHVRFGWELFGPDSLETVVAGTDFGTMADGRLQRVVGFIDRMPG